MKIKKITINAFSFDLRKITVFIKRKADYIALTLLFTCGLVAGSVFIYNSENYRYIFSAFHGNALGFHQLLVNGIFVVFLLLTSGFSMGLCIVGTPFICILSVFEGVYISSVFSLRLYECGYNGIWSFYFTELVFYIIMYILIALTQFSALDMSQKLKRYFSGEDGSVILKGYLLKYLVVTLISLFLVMIKSLIISLL